MDIDLDKLPLRDLQKESTRALLTMDGTSHGISKYNKKAHHNSHNWYSAVIEWYIEQYGDLPSRAGPGKQIKLILDDSR